MQIAPRVLLCEDIVCHNANGLLLPATRRDLSKHSRHGGTHLLESTRTPYGSVKDGQTFGRVSVQHCIRALRKFSMFDLRW